MTDERAMTKRAMCLVCDGVTYVEDIKTEAHPELGPMAVCECGEPDSMVSVYTREQIITAFAMWCAKVESNWTPLEVADMQVNPNKYAEEFGAVLCNEMDGSVLHASDCATHDAPAMEPGSCDCGEENNT